MNICNCTSSKNKVNSGKFRAVEVNFDGTCKNCGHYTLHTNNPAYKLPVKRRTVTKQKRLIIESYLKSGIPIAEIAKELNLDKTSIIRVKKQSYVKLYLELQKESEKLKSILEQV